MEQSDEERCKELLDDAQQTSAGIDRRFEKQPEFTALLKEIQETLADRYADLLEAARFLHDG